MPTTFKNIAKKIQNIIPSKILIKKKNFDPRSYNLDSSKLLKLGFKPKKKIEDAINEIKDHYQSGKLKDARNKLGLSNG